MRDSRFDSQSFCSELENQVDECLKLSSEVLSRITPSEWNDFENLFRISDRRAENLIRLAIISWYIPEEIGILLRLSIEEQLSEDISYIQLLLYSKGEMKCFLCDTRLWHTRDFFGNVLSVERLKRSLNSVHPIMKTKRRPKRVQRHRGYRDKGTLRLNSDKHTLWISTDEQNRLEEERINRQSTLDFLRGFIGLGG